MQVVVRSAETGQCGAGHKPPHLQLLLSTTLMGSVMNRKVGQNPHLHDEWLRMLGTVLVRVSGNSSAVGQVSLLWLDVGRSSDLSASPQLWDLRLVLLL